jgi:hypothetical protein
MNRSLRGVEKKLESAFQPVEPNPAFVSDLRLRIEKAVEHRVRIKKVKKGLWIAGGVVGALVMIVTIIRSLTSWEEIAQSVSNVFSKEDREHQTASV